LTPLLEGLARKGLYDDTLIVLTADHGQELLEHGGYTHSHALWEVIIHVPFIVKFPKGDRPEALGPRRHGLSRAIDLYPALLAAAGIEVPAGLPGVDIFSAEEVDWALAERFSAGAEVDRAVVRDSMKMIRRVDKPPALFDLSQDPDELNDIAVDQPAVITEIDEMISRFIAEHPIRLQDIDSSAPQLSEEQIEALRSLGYLH
jgi:arylsulfatase A-like enzyme